MIIRLLHDWCEHKKDDILDLYDSEALALIKIEWARPTDGIQDISTRKAFERWKWKRDIEFSDEFL